MRVLRSRAMDNAPQSQSEVFRLSCAFFLSESRRLSRRLFPERNVPAFLLSRPVPGDGYIRCRPRLAVQCTQAGSDLHPVGPAFLLPSQTEFPVQDTGDRKSVV